MSKHVDEISLTNIVNYCKIKKIKKGGKKYKK